MTALLLAATARGPLPGLPSGDPEALWIADAIYGVLFLAGVLVDLLLIAVVLNRPERFARPAARLRRRPIGLGDALALLGLLALLFCAAGLLATFAPLSEGALVALQSILFHWLLVYLLIRALRRRGVSGARAFGFRPRRLVRDILFGALAYLAMIPVFVLCMAVYRLLLDALGYEPRIQEVARIITDEGRPLLRAYLYFVGIVLAPIAEELVFRGVALPVLARRTGILPAVVLISLLFAGIHFHPEAVLPLFLVSIAFCAGYAVTGSITVPIVMHVLFNGVNLLIQMGMA